jgi:hypothetical protein
MLIEEEELSCNDGGEVGGRKGESVRYTKLLNVFDRIVFKDSQDFLGLLPKELDEYFTNKVLALKLGISVRLAQKITYCLKKWM